MVKLSAIGRAKLAMVSTYQDGQDMIERAEETGKLTFHSWATIDQDVKLIW